jgi:hypothetical protein
MQGPESKLLADQFLNLMGEVEEPVENMIPVPQLDDLLRSCLALEFDLRIEHGDKRGFGLFYFVSQFILAPALLLSFLYMFPSLMF